MNHSEYVNIDEPKKKQKIIEARDYITKAISNRKESAKVSNSNLIYFKSILNFYLHQFYEALIDIDGVIDKDGEDPYAKFYLLRGRCYSCLSMFSEAIKDFTRAITLDDSIMDAYLNRGKCAYLLGDTGLAFLDFQKTILIEAVSKLHNFRKIPWSMYTQEIF
jgi:tetratricopeptide (TPR) repeat protein